MRKLMNTTYNGNIRDVSDIESDDFLKVNICGVSSYTLGDYTTVRERGRRDYLLMYIKKGKINIKVSGKNESAAAGSVIIYHPHEPQQYSYKKSDNYECIWVHFTGSGVKKLMGDLKIDEKRVFNINDTAAFEEVLTGILPEHRLQRRGADYAEAALVMQLLVLLGRNDLEPALDCSTSRQKIDSILLEMEKNATDSFKVEDYAEKVHLSIGRFTHIFSETVGVSPHKYMIMLKMKKAKQLLRQTDHSVKEIAELSGFSDPMYFSRIFKKYVGCTPMQYRKSGCDGE